MRGNYGPHARSYATTPPSAHLQIFSRQPQQNLLRQPAPKVKIKASKTQVQIKEESQTDTEAKLDQLTGLSLEEIAKEGLLPICTLSGFSFQWLSC